MAIKLAIGLLSLLVSLKLFAAEVAVFVSFSMPETLLAETLKDCARFKIPAYLNGLYHNSMNETVTKILALSQKIPKLALQIDPTAFERFAIKQVPALIVAKDEVFDVIYGHLSIHEGLLRVSDLGESGLTIEEVRRITDG
ncbi:type-F conjugative transfer system pilin assembly protein TrbC [Legionella sp.]|uniref:type-F conjugative transfer system pilin assembly protein TrbC n=1 Tax=Legionella sp. TaxID=459 RepID=UPI00321F82F9